MTYEEHPARKQAEAAHETHRKESLLKMMAQLKVDSNKYNQNMTVDELQELYNQETEMMIKKQMKKDESEELTIEDSEEVDTGDGPVNIEPKIQKNSIYGVMGNTTEETSESTWRDDEE